jgi:hypothetical protein
MLSSKERQFFLYLNITIQMEYSRESQDRMKKIADLKAAGVICYANNYTGKIDISDIRARSENDDEGGYIREIENLQAG